MRFSIKAVGAVAALAIGASAAQAQDVRFVGSASGAFAGAGATQASNLTYAGSTFDNTTAGGFAGFGSAPAMTASGNFNNFGSLMLSNSDFVAGGTFTLDLLFTRPTGIAPGGQTQSFLATVVGTVTSAGNGGVRIDFDNTPRALTFTGPDNGGSFLLQVNDVSIDAPSAARGMNIVAVTGNITGASVVPEPSTYALLGAGLAGLVAARRRRTTAA